MYDNQSHGKSKVDTVYDTTIINQAIYVVMI